MNELMRLIATVEPPDIRQLRPDLPASVAQVVAKALRKRPEDRYQTGQQLATDLRSACAAIGGTGPVVYDSARDVTGHEMADYQETVTETPARRGAEPPPISGAR
jgi:serine/threonine-protein kinase